MIGRYLGKQNNNCIGVDITSTAIKVVELSHHTQGYCLEAFYIEKFPSNAVVEQSIVLDEVVGEAVKKAIQRSGSRLKKAILAVSGSTVITKTVQMNALLQGDDMDFQIRVEADQYIPYPVDEVALDWEIQGPNKDSPDQVDVLLAACRSETIERRIDAVEYAGLEVNAVDVEVFCVERAYRLLSAPLKLAASSVIALFDIGANITTINVIQAGQSIYNQQQLFGGHQLTEEIMSRYDLTESQAVKLKMEEVCDKNYEAEVLPHFRRVVVQQINRYLQLFYSTTEFTNVDHIILAGGTSMISGLGEDIEKALATKVTIANPFVDMALSAKVNPARLNMNASALLVACGLALRGL